MSTKPKSYTKFEDKLQIRSKAAKLFPDANNELDLNRLYLNLADRDASGLQFEDYKARFDLENDQVTWNQSELINLARQLENRFQELNIPFTNFYFLPSLNLATPSTIPIYIDVQRLELSDHAIKDMLVQLGRFYDKNIQPISEALATESPQFDPTSLITLVQQLLKLDGYIGRLLAHIYHLHDIDILSLIQARNDEMQLQNIARLS